MFRTGQAAYFDEHAEQMPCFQGQGHQGLDGFKDYCKGKKLKFEIVIQPDDRPDKKLNNYIKDG